MHNDVQLLGIAQFHFFDEVLDKAERRCVCVSLK